MMTIHDIDTVTDILTHHGCTVAPEQRMLLARYAELLLDWNAKINLISRKDVAQLWRNHILHSLLPLMVASLPENGVIVDIGSGGGLPGIPLAIMLPNSQFVLVDSIRKKIRAVEEMAAKLGLGNVTTVNGRIEDNAVLDEYAGTADLVTARAVTKLDALVRWAAPLLRTAGERRLLVWKGGDLSEEIQTARRHPLVRDIRESVLEIPGEPWFTAEEKKLVEVRFR